MAASFRPDIILIDLGLPDMDGKAVVKALREWSETPIIVLTAREQEQEKIAALDVGADDYVTKPFSIQIFLKKTERLMQLISPAKERAEDGYEDEALRIGLESMSASYCGRDISFTPLEYRLLGIFIHNPGIVLTRQKLLERLWDDQGNFVDEHTLTTVISRMRGKLEGSHPYIKTVYGMGYLWNAKSGRRDG